MNQHNALFHALKAIAAPTEIQQVHAVADAIGCPEWTDGCNRKPGEECWCATAAARVVEIENGKPTLMIPRVTADTRSSTSTGRKK